MISLIDPIFGSGGSLLTHDKLRSRFFPSHMHKKVRSCHPKIGLFMHEEEAAKAEKEEPCLCSPSELMSIMDCLKVEIKV